LEQEKKLFSRTCRICDSFNIKYSFSKNGYSIFYCTDCGFLFINPQPSDEVLAEIYKSSYFLGDGSEKEEKERSEMKLETAKLYLQVLIDYYGNTEGNLLEIGCGTGEFLLLAKKTGFNVTGIEISQSSTDIANSKLENASVICGSLENMELPEHSFDICVLFDAIEHVRSPVDTLSKIHNLLKPGGVIFMATPSLDSWSGRLMKSNWMEFKTEHLSYFDSQTMQNILVKTGFEHVSITPNYKYLQIDYIKKHFEKFKVPFFTGLVSFATFFIPQMFLRKNFKIIASGINVLARSKPLSEKQVVSIIIPVYNEVNTFSELIDLVINKEITSLEKEIIIVESNSNDGTREEVLKYKDIPGIKVILEEKPQGKGHAVKTGIKHATGDFILIQDGDLEYDLNDYDQLLEPLVKYQKAFVLGSRHLRGWKMRQFTGQPLMALFMNCGQIFFTTLLNVFCGQNMKDPFTMYKLFRRDCLYGMSLVSNRFDLDWEIVIKLVRKGYTPLEIPVNYKSRSFKEGKKVSILKDPITWIWALFKFRFGPLFDKKVNSE